MNMRSCSVHVPVQNTPFYKRIRRQITVVSAAEDAAAEVVSLGDMVEVHGAEGADPPSTRASHSLTLNYDSALNHHLTCVKG